MLALEAPEVDGHLQLTSFIHQPKTLSFKVSVYIHKLFPEPAQRTHSFLEELVTDGTPPARKLKCATGSILHAGSC